MNGLRVDVRVERSWSLDAYVVLWTLPRVGGMKRQVVEPPMLSVKALEEGEAVREPTFAWDRETAQAMMDALWGAGLRPTEAQYPNDHVNALRDHLADMRRLVFEDAKGLK